MLDHGLAFVDAAGLPAFPRLEDPKAPSEVIHALKEEAILRLYRHVGYGARAEEEVSLPLGPTRPTRSMRIMGFMRRGRLR
jgi:hypothetical protein